MADVAYRLEYSSPQSFGRHLRAMLGVTALEFRLYEIAEVYAGMLAFPWERTAEGLLAAMNRYNPEPTE